MIYKKIKWIIFICLFCETEEEYVILFHITILSYYVSDAISSGPVTPALSESQTNFCNVILKLLFSTSQNNSSI